MPEYKLRIVQGKQRGKQLMLQSLEPSNALVVGSSADCDWQISDRYVSRRHFEIEKSRESQPHFLLKDLGSTHGTRVNNITINKVTLCDGDTIRIGTTEIRYEQINSFLENWFLLRSDRSISENDIFSTRLDCVERRNFLNSNLLKIKLRDLSSGVVAE